MAEMHVQTVGWTEAASRLDATKRGIPPELYNGVRRGSLIMERAVKRQITEQFGGGNQWRASWSSAVFVTGDNVAGVVGSAHPASRIQELGGTIRPRVAGALTIPLSREARRSRARDYQDAFILRAKSGKAFIAQRTSTGLKYLYLLARQVTLKPTLYLTHAKERAEGDVIAAVGGRVAIVIQTGGRS